MHWEATDQFGNLYVGVSEAESVDDLRPHLASLVEELCQRTPDPIQVTIDTGYAEINGPNPEQVAYVLQVPWLSGQGPDVMDQVSAAIREICNQNSLSRVSVACV